MKYFIFKRMIFIVVVLMVYRIIIHSFIQLINHLFIYLFIPSLINDQSFIYRSNIRRTYDEHNMREGGGGSRISLTRSQHMYFQQIIEKCK